MKRRNRNLRVILVAAVLVLALGATQAAVIPRASDGQDSRDRFHPVRSLHLWATSVLRLVNLGVWFTPAPNPTPVLQPPSQLSPDPLPYSAPVDPGETCTRKTIDDNHPF